eukprot:6147996-Alexandrium_andersonii.AAC.1
MPSAREKKVELKPPAQSGKPPASDGRPEAPSSARIPRGTAGAIGSARPQSARASEPAAEASADPGD